LLLAFGQAVRRHEFWGDLTGVSRFDDDRNSLSAIANVIIGQLRHGGSYIAAPQLIMQSGRLALIISGVATSVARRGPDGWHYVISRLDL
jgi:hypothetical protein